jgi:DNA-binding NarL/FixJ family response regulator
MNSTTFITLVDDHVLLRNGLATLINSFDGYKVLFEADNGQDFIRQLKPKHAPDIVLLDITMPLMNGYETAGWIRANLPDTKVLVLSMMDNDSAIIRMLKYGAKGYILKDSKPATFKDAMDSIRDHGFYINDLVSSKMLYYVNKSGEESGQKDSSLMANLSERELTFLKWICTEKTHKEIAEEMFVSPRTVDGYRDILFEKLGVTSRVGLVLFAIRNGIVVL